MSETIAKILGARTLDECGATEVQRRQMRKAGTDPLVTALNSCTLDEARAVYAAIAQFVENEDCSDEDVDEDQLVAAKSVLERLDAAIASAAE